jgi:predicted  nucleic acid-binding Zn-ribbon protein
MKKLIAAFIAVALVSSALSYGILKLQQNSQAYNSEIDGLESKINDLNSSLALLSDRLQNVNASLMQTSSDLQELANKTSHYANMTQPDVQSLQTSLDLVQAIIVTIQENITSLQGTVDAVQSDLKTAQTQLATAQTQMTSLSENITSIQTQTTQIIDNINALTTDVTKIKNDSKTLENDITALENDTSALKTQLTSVQTQVTTILTDISNIQASVSSLQSKIVDLDASKSTVIRVWIRSFTSSDLFGNSVPPNVISVYSGIDWLIDAQVTWNGLVISQSRTGHSRFFVPEYIDLSVQGFNRTQLLGQSVRIELVAYWHAQDAVIDINPTHNHPWNDHWDWQNNEFSIDYVVGSQVGPITMTGDGSPRYISFPLLYPIISKWYSYATMTYQIETF